MAVWITWMLVDSKGSMNPDDKPIATTLRIQDLRRIPGTKRIVRGSALCSPSRLARSTDVASSSLIRSDEKTYPLPMRCWSGIRHCQPAFRAITRVSGIKGSTRAQGTATARSQRSHSDQGSNPASSSCSINNPRNPEQSMKRSPSTRAPLARMTAATSPLF